MSDDEICIRINLFAFYASSIQDGLAFVNKFDEWTALHWIFIVFVSEQEKQQNIEDY